MKKILIGIFVVFCFFSCAKKEDDKVLATIDQEKITLEEFNKELDKIPMNVKMAMASESGKKDFLNNLIIRKILLREAEKNKIESETEFQTQLLDFKNQLLITSLLKKKITSNSQLGDEEAKKYYEENKEKFKKENEINTRHILLKTEEEAKQIKEKIKNGEDFTELAKQYSIDPNAKTTGGELGFHPKGTILPEYEEAAFRLSKVGQISGIVKTQYGYHIIRLEGIKPPAYVSFDEVKDFIKQQMAQEKQKELIDTYIEDLKRNTKITINESLLKEEKTASPEKPENKDKTGKEPVTDAPKTPQKTDAGPAEKK